MDTFFDMVCDMVVAYVNWWVISDALSEAQLHGTYKQVKSLSGKEKRAWQKQSSVKWSIQDRFGIPYSVLSEALFENGNDVFPTHKVWLSLLDYVDENGIDIDF